MGKFPWYSHITKHHQIDLNKKPLMFSQQGDLPTQPPNLLFVYWPPMDSPPPGDILPPGGNYQIRLFVYPPWNEHGTRKWMVGILVSFWDGLFSGAMLVSGRVSLSVSPGQLWTAWWTSSYTLHTAVYRIHTFLHHTGAGVELLGRIHGFSVIKCMVKNNQSDGFFQNWVLGAPPSFFLCEKQCPKVIQN